MNSSYSSELSQKNLNPQLKRALFSSYCGSISEIADLLRYFYQSMIIGDEYFYFKEALQEVILGEERHLLLLGKIMSNLGIDPHFLNMYPNLKQYCITSGQSDHKNIKIMLSDNINCEKQSIIKYRALCEIVESEDTRSILSMIINEEETHRDLFKKLYAKYF